MYKTVTVWIEAGKGKLAFNSNCNKNDPWLAVEDGKYNGGISFHFDADGLRQFITALQVLEKNLKEETERVKEVKVK